MIVIFLFLYLLYKCMPEFTYLIPASTGKVGNSHRSRTIFQREASQLSHATPLGEIIHHLPTVTVAQTIHQTIIHDIIHTTMAAYLFGCFFQFLMNRMLIFVHQFPFHIFGQEPCAFRFSWLATTFVSTCSGRRQYSSTGYLLAYPSVPTS